MDSFVNTYWINPHTVMGSFLYEGYRKLSLKQINSAVLASQFRRVFRSIVRKRSGQYLSKKICGIDINMSIPHSVRNLC